MGFQSKVKNAKKLKPEKYHKILCVLKWELIFLSFHGNPLEILRQYKSFLEVQKKRLHITNDSLNQIRL